MLPDCTLEDGLNFGLGNKRASGVLMAISWAGREVSRFLQYYFDSNKKKKDNVLHCLSRLCGKRWHKNHDKNKCRRAGVGNRQNLVWPPELVNFACGGVTPEGFKFPTLRIIVMDDAGLMLPADPRDWLPGNVPSC